MVSPTKKGSQTMSEQQQQYGNPQETQELAISQSTTPEQIGDMSFDVLLSPREIIAQSQEQAKALMEVVEQQQLYQTVKNRKFLQVEAWQLIGQFTHTKAIPVELEQTDEPDRIRFKCTVELRDRAGDITGGGSAEAHNKEEGKARLTENQIGSTAQTRAISKAYRNKYAFIAKLAGFEATTAEEMTGAEQGTPRTPQAQPPTTQAPAKSQPTTEPNPPTTEPPQSTPEELKAYIECKEECLTHVNRDEFIETAIGLGYEGKKPSTLTAEELEALLDACMKLKAKADEAAIEDEPMEPFPTPESVEGEQSARTATEDSDVKQNDDEEAPF